LLVQIAAGELDPHLTAIAWALTPRPSAVDRRLDMKRTTRRTADASRARPTTPRPASAQNAADALGTASEYRPCALTVRRTALMTIAKTNAAPKAKRPATRAPEAPHRHHRGEHTETELRYYRPCEFAVPESLGGMARELSCPNPHVDRYYEAPRNGAALLRDAGASLRVRVKSNGSVLSTFKLKLAEEGVCCRREETEGEVRCIGCEHPAVQCECGLCTAADNYVLMVNLAASDALEKARELTGGAPMVFMFAISNDRMDHHYRSADTHVVLSEDTITHPDGSVELRVEVEHVTGEPVVLERIHRELKALYPNLRRVKRGKLSEGRRRLAALLAA
jgi:hypothetical protein